MFDQWQHLLAFRWEIVKSEGQQTLLFFSPSVDSSTYVYVICLYIFCCCVIVMTILDIIKCSSVQCGCSHILVNHDKY